MRPYDPRLDPQPPTSEEKAMVCFFILGGLGVLSVIAGAVLQALGVL